MNFLKNTKCYLSGPIENDNNRANNWRVPVIDHLRHTFGIEVFDPNDDPKQQKAWQLEEARKNKDLKKIQEVAWGFVRKDLDMVDRSDFLIARIAYEEVFYKQDVEHIISHLRQVPTTGTIHEIINADHLHRPTLLVCEQGAEYLPAWLIGFIKLEYLFSSWDELYQYLQKVDNGGCKHDQRWSIVYGLI